MEGDFLYCSLAETNEVFRRKANDFDDDGGKIDRCKDNPSH